MGARVMKLWEIKTRRLVIRPLAEVDAATASVDLHRACEARRAPALAMRGFKDNTRPRKPLEKIGLASPGRCKRFSKARGEALEKFTRRPRSVEDQGLELNKFEKRYAS